ncbi:non-specific lipid-transfer protein A-like [Pyrus ussuriensis x Pyrus communis]|uniref:Non-specific lipid-transfer protein n=1 Tax=Pyrus ussuriensis x Pyrus communis TaxID=2448454 RepID=A0A5N5EZB4_9ROSA|nr:non-specific lipid-transfer protein A-like [Pyrus ussuriensis x Pyrus communis]
MSRLIGFLAVLLLLSITAHSAPSCPAVKQEVSPCVTFVKGGADAKPSEECCKGVKNLSVNAANKADKEAVCLCLKQALSTVGTYNPSQVSALPKKCGISLDLPAIDKDTDCTNIIPIS